MFTAALFTVANTWNQPRCPTTNEGIKKMWYIYTVEYYSAISKDEIMTFAGECMKLEIITLSEISHTQEDNVTCFLPSTCASHVASVIGVYYHSPFDEMGCRYPFAWVGLEWQSFQSPPLK
jgi:hypothetical protein